MLSILSFHADISNIYKKKTLGGGEGWWNGNKCIIVMSEGSDMSIRHVNCSNHNTSGASRTLEQHKHFGVSVGVCVLMHAFQVLMLENVISAILWELNVAPQSYLDVHGAPFALVLK